MVRRLEQQRQDRSEHKYGGEGTVLMRYLLEGPAELSHKGRLFARITLEPGCGIGLHRHEGESETFCFLEGRGEYNDNGAVIEVGPGDVAYTAPGQSHSIRNTGTETLSFIALILYE